VLINTRGAADLLGATKMDRPEDVDVSPTTGKVYVTMTKNKKRGTGESEGLQTDPGVDAANPRDDNGWGHIIEFMEGADGGVNHTSTGFRWEMFMLCGDPSQQGGIRNLDDLTADESYFAGFDPNEVSAIATPDNIVFDEIGNLWIATDGQPSAPNFGQNDGVFACPTEGPDRGWNRQFLSGVPGGEVCGPEFSGDNRTFYCGVQHPGENGGLPNTISGWPDSNYPPKPSIIAVRNTDKEKIGR
jgi:secreted PhoX family phosphatase